MKVLVTGAGALLGQGLIRALRASSLKTEIIAVDPNPLSAGLYWADTAHLVPMASHPDYHDAMTRLLALERPDAVLVGTDVELAYFAANRPELESAFDTHVVVSSPRVVSIADDKWLTFKFFKEAGFSPPDSVLPGDEHALLDRVGFPLVVKPRRGARSVGVSIVHSERELAAALERGNGQVIQECVGTADQEYTAGFVAFEGQCHASITMRRDLRDGNTYRAFPMPDFKHDADLRRMVEALDVYGPVNLQFRLVGDRVAVFEINGRFSGTTPLRGLVGFPEVEMVLRHIVLGEKVVQPTISTDVILRHWSEVVVPAAKLLNHPQR